jgi:acetyltransferase-like isoleucine patch superfamily enzyme
MAEPRLLEIKLIDVTCGEAVTIVEPSNLYGCTLGDKVFIGPFVEVQRDVTIGARTRIQSHTFICSLVTIGEDCFVAHGVMFINDLFENGTPSGRPEAWKPTRIGHRVSIGSNATILPVDICDDVVIGAGAVVTKSIAKAGIYAGNPARLVRTLP